MKCGIIAILVISVGFLGSVKSCSENWNLLDGVPWNVTSRNGTRLYQISLCHPLKYDSFPEKSCDQSAVCMIENGTARSLVNFSSVASSFSQLHSYSLLELKALPCSNTNRFQKTTILFKCDVHLNFPKLIFEDNCTAHFVWATSAACNEIPKRKEVSCYAYNKDGKIKDLTPLIKQRSGYAVASTDFAIEFFINVCSDIIQENETKGCPQGAAACQKIGSEVISFGSPDNALFSSGSSLKIVYKSANNTAIPAGCDMPPSTTITFTCPPKGRNRNPQVIANSNCQYEIEWQTEYSCPLDTLTTDLKTCKFTRAQHGMELDLSPLRKQSGGYRVMHSVGNINTTFLLNVCGGLGDYSVCKKWRSNSVCLNDSSGHQISLGNMKGANLRYSDGQVKLTYVSNTNCQGKESSSVFKTIIEFQCEPNAEENNGVGQPQFVEADNCVYLFNWKTKHACPKHPLSSSCYVDAENVHIDLGMLIKNTDDKPWQVVNILEKSNQDTYYLNVCGSILSNINGSRCMAGAALCKIGADNSSINFGMFTSSPTYNKQFKTVHMTYEEGDSCGDGQRETQITFHCKPGVLNSPPVLDRLSDDGCIAMIRWHTAAACPQAVKKGNNCKIIDKELGLVFDLNPLRKDTYYKIKKDNYTYYLNVCDKVKGTLCDTTQGQSQNAAACQEEEGKTIPIKLGEPNSELLYVDGMINLTYTLGTPYNNGKKIPRTTSITFLCDETAGFGHPEFIEEAHHAYSFRWYTSYACAATVAAECLAVDPVTKEQYDLSRLIKTKDEQNWMFSENFGNKTKKFYLNVCRPLTYVDTYCPSSSSVCMIETDKSQDSSVITNLGQMSHPPTVKGKGYVMLVYTNGDYCRYFGTNSTYNTTIYFTCSVSEHLLYIGEQGHCQHTFLWESSAACPVEEAKSESVCNIKDPVTGVTYDFMHLKTNYYNVTAGTRKFQVNICGAVSGGCSESGSTNDVAACETDDKGNLKNIIGLLEGYSLEMSEDKVVTLTYSGKYNQSTGAASKVYIRFKCNKLGVDNHLTFKQEGNSHDYYFELSSPLVCSSEQVDCMFSDEFGNNYDLTPLIKRHSNWEVIDSRLTHSDLQYHINFCIPVNPTETYKCPVGAIGVCQTSTKHTEEGFNLGTFHQHSVMEGSIVMHYIGGTTCHNHQYNRSTDIVLYCSEIQTEPVFIGETERCEYYFSMNTPAACPLKDSYGNNCAVTVPEFGYRFDLSSLQQIGQYQIKDDEYEYILNVCGPISNPAPNCHGSGACQRKPSDPSFVVDIGKSSSKLHYNNGVVQLVYESGKGNCHGTYNRSTIITFVCNHQMPESVPRFLSEKDDCTYLFEWPTSLVCLDRKLQECSVSSGDKHYDLSSLSLSIGNYFVTLQGEMFAIINICKTLSLDQNSQKCSPDSAACIIQYDRNKILKTTNIGTPGAPYLENDVLKLRYILGDHCEYSTTMKERRNFETVIEFECDEQMLENEPRFVGFENCTYYFTWRHVSACLVKSETALNDNCTAVNPVTGFVYDLSPLKHKSFYRIKNKQHEFNINVCAAINNSICDTKSGSCQKEIDGSRKWNMGNYNSRIHFHENTMILNYTNGDICHGQYHRNTIIQFSCGVGKGHPTFLFESDECTYYFSWQTVYACEDKVHCVVINGSEIIDLSPLSLDAGYHTAVDLTSDNNKYIINVCSPLVNTNPQCYSSGVCHIGNPIESLGRPHGPPFIDFFGYVTVIYTDGARCNDEYNSTSRIVFFCDPDAGTGEPSLIKKDDAICHYLFEWKTSLVCPESESSLSISDCKYVDINRNINIDLSPLRKSNASYEVKGKHGEKFTINVCGASEFGVSDCSSAGVCLHGLVEKESYGSVDSATLSYNGKELTLAYDSGSSCPLSDTGKRTSRILFICDQKEGLGNPVMYKQSSCIAAFKWKTSLVCIEKTPECTFMANNIFYDLRLISSITHSWNMSDSSGNEYWLNVCKSAKIDSDLGNCMNSGVCMKHRNGTIFSLGTLYSSTLNIDDNKEITLSYRDGDKICSGMSAVSNIQFICGKAMSKPKFISGPSNSCEFDFIWETIVACGETRKEVLPMSNNIIVDPNLGYEFDMSTLFNRTFFVEWNGSDHYIYVINLRGVKLNTPAKECVNAAVCQTKPETFYRDLGTVSTEKFYLKGNELQLELLSYGRKCGKNKDKNVTTIINFVCAVAAGVGKPLFYYESGNCDYLFNWETELVCPKIKKNDSHTNIAAGDRVDIKQVEKTSVSHTLQAVIAVILSASLVGLLVFIVSKEERRNAIKRKVGNIFMNIHLPRLWYRRGNNETLLLSSGTTISCHDESDVEILT